MTTEEEFVERSFYVLPMSECRKVFNRISVFELCAKVVENALTCNIQKGSPLGYNTHCAIYLTFEFDIIHV